MKITRRSLLEAATPALPLLGVAPLFTASAAARTLAERQSRGSRLTENINGGQVDWTRAVARVAGFAPKQRNAQDASENAVMMRRVALVDSYRRMAEVLAGVRVEGRTTVKNFQLEDDTIVTEVQGVIKNGVLISEQQLPDGRYKVVLEVPLYGERNSLLEAIDDKVFTETLLPETPIRQPAAPSAPVAPVEPVEPARPAYLSRPRPLKPGEMRVARVDGFPRPANGEYTSLLVDARSLILYPCISPKLFSESGEEVYGTLKVSPDWAIEHGIVSFPRSMEQALKVPRAGERPLILRALRVIGPGSTQLVISDSDAARANDANSRSGFFEACAVIFLTEGR